MNKPSSNWLRFLRWFCPSDLYEGVEGDLLEQYEIDAEQFGLKKASWKFKWNVLRFFRLGILMRNRFNNRLTNVGMLRNYFTIANRNIARNPGYTALNVIGLALGLASCFVIGFYVRYETSFELFMKTESTSTDIFPATPRMAK
ncbi:permease prefix domain 2-containing transporter [uncultured Imperialibacter sp.]|uniref:permease prefix domain 2-containing transporter n=1 Tax=uncultured Imperialibacter sp. TaxID=1672639 RepID=UPI0030D8231F|tara:strand:+ start:17967 stop:18398 length:432 start_codon:yes stop_codon:yes gene_type:complete